MLVLPRQKNATRTCQKVPYPALLQHCKISKYLIMLTYIFKVKQFLLDLFFEAGLGREVWMGVPGSKKRQKIEHLK